METLTNEVIKIRYTKTFVAFLDVLGFKTLVQKDRRDKLNKYFNILNRVITDIRNIDSKKDIGFIVISDSIIMSIPQGKNLDQKKNNLKNLCVAVGLIQKQLALINIWLRGGISSGNAYFDKTRNQIIGPAYINAFLLEENMAIYPRVLLDTKIIKELQYSNAKELIYDINKDLNINWCSTILYNWYYLDHKPDLLNQDIALFIDYLSPIVKDNNDLLLLINNIESNIYSNTQIYSKYRWVSDYLKSVVQKLDRNDDNIGILNKLNCL